MEKGSKIGFENLERESESLLAAAILSKLELTHEERIEAHENALALINDLQKAGEEFRAKPERTSKKTS